MFEAIELRAEVNAMIPEAVELEVEVNPMMSEAVELMSQVIRPGMEKRGFK